MGLSLCFWRFSFTDNSDIKKRVWSQGTSSGLVIFFSLEDAVSPASLPLFFFGFGQKQE